MEKTRIRRLAIWLAGAVMAVLLLGACYGPEPYGYYHHRPGYAAPYHHRSWVPGHYNGSGHWTRGHWRRW